MAKTRKLVRLEVEVGIADLMESLLTPSNKMLSKAQRDVIAENGLVLFDALTTEVWPDVVLAPEAGPQEDVAVVEEQSVVRVVLLRFELEEELTDTEKR